MTYNVFGGTLNLTLLWPCPVTKLNGGLSQLHSADDAAIAWLPNYGS